MHNVLFLVREFGQSLRQNRFLHFTYGTQVTVSLLVLGIFFILLVGSAVVWHKLGQGLQVHVYLQDGLSEDQKNALEADIRRLESVVRVVYRSKTEALELFKKSSPNIDLDKLPQNPLPESFVLSVDEPRNIAGVAEHVQTLTGVMAVRYGAQVVERYIKVLMLLALICLVTITLLVLFTASSINNIIAMSVYARRTEIRIMQLVGATWWFIRWPFIFEGLFFGMVGATIAICIIWLALYALSEALRLSELSFAMPQLGLSGNQVLLALAGLLLGLGGLVGFTGSLRTVNNFLGREHQLTVEQTRVRQTMR